MQTQHSSSLENVARHHLGSKAALNRKTARDGGILMTFRPPELEKDLRNYPALDTLSQLDRATKTARSEKQTFL